MDIVEVVCRVRGVRARACVCVLEREASLRDLF